MISRRSFLTNGVAVGFFAASDRSELFSQSNFGLRKTLRTSEWPTLNQEEENILNLRLSDDDAKKLIDYKVNQCVYQNPNVHNALKNYTIKGKPLEIKRDLEADYVLGRFYAGVMERAHQNNPKDAQLTLGQTWDAFLDHCSFHVLKDGIRWLAAKAQNLPLDDHIILHPKLAIKEAALKNSIPIYEILMGGVETWSVFQNLPCDLKKINIWNEYTVERIAEQLPRYDLLAIMKKLGTGTGLLKITANDLSAIGINDAEVMARLTCKCAVPSKAAYAPL